MPTARGADQRASTCRGHRRDRQMRCSPADEGIALALQRLAYESETRPELRRPTSPNRNHIPLRPHLDEGIVTTRANATNVAFSKCGPPLSRAVPALAYCALPKLPATDSLLAMHQQNNDRRRAHKEHR